MKSDSITLWEQRIEMRKASGLTIEDWCKQHQIAPPTYYYWNRKIADIKSEQKSAPIFAEVPADSTKQNAALDQSDLLVTWNDLSISVTDKQSARLAAYFLHCLREQC